MIKRNVSQFGRHSAISRCGALLTAALLLSACAVGPDYAGSFISLPSTWGNAKVASPKIVPLSHWWNRLGDPTLNALIEEAVQTNLDLASAKARIREARAVRRQAIGALLPLIDGAGSATHNRSATISGGSFNQFQAGFDSSWELDLFGANRRGLEAATYVEMRGYQARIALARRTVLAQRQTALLTQKKFEAGSSSAVDAAKAAGLAATTESYIPTYEASYADAVHRVGVLLGREPTALAQRFRPILRIPAPRLPLPTGIPADVLVQRPDVRLAERRYAQYTAKVGQAEAALYPSVSLTGSVSTTGLNVGDIGKGSSIGWSIGPTRL